MPAGSQSPHCTRIILVLVSMRDSSRLTSPGCAGEYPEPEAVFGHPGGYGALGSVGSARIGFSTRIATPWPPPAQAVAMP